jgi:ABC-type antimicrobial peptide transport system permease subunit
VLLAILFGLPAGYWLLNEWLEKFAFRVPLSVWYFVSAGFIAMGIAWITVASQAVRASRVNPAECLKSE